MKRASFLLQAVEIGLSSSGNIQPRAHTGTRKGFCRWKVANKKSVRSTGRLYKCFNVLRLVHMRTVSMQSPGMRSVHVAEGTTRYTHSVWYRVTLNGIDHDLLKQLLCRAQCASKAEKGWTGRERRREGITTEKTTQEENQRQTERQETSTLRNSLRSRRMLFNHSLPIIYNHDTSRPTAGVSSKIQHWPREILTRYIERLTGWGLPITDNWTCFTITRRHYYGAGQDQNPERHSYQREWYL